MANNPDPMRFLEAKEDVMENLETVEIMLEQAADQGMIDVDDIFHNELLDLIDDAAIVDSWPELAEIISRAKILEENIDTWLSLKGITTIDLEWPHIPH